MQHLVENLQFRANIEFVSEASPCFKSLDYPPKDDFVMSIDQKGDVITQYGDDVWDFSAFGCAGKLHFSEFDETNKALFKQLMYYIIYSHLFSGNYKIVVAWYMTFQNIFKTCVKYKLDAREVHRYPKVIEEIAEFDASSSPSRFVKNVHTFDRILKNQEQIGFTLLNGKNIILYKQFDPNYADGQTPYIPNRIWTIYIQHLETVLDDFEAQQNKLEALYHYITRISLLNKKNGVSSKIINPFNHVRANNKVCDSGTFEDYLKANDLMALFDKYTKKTVSNGFDSGTHKYTIDQFTYLLNNISMSCYLYILYYSIMRKEEALSLRIDCLKIENDERLGDFYLLAGETTKTDLDSDARWVVPKRVKRAVDVAKTLVDWKTQYIDDLNEAPYLFQNMRVWQKSSRTSKARIIGSFYNSITLRAGHFFKFSQYKITQMDYDEALALTPSLIRQDWFKVGNVWRFGYHQFRRTLAVHFAVNKVPASSTQLQMKHGTREQQFHYQNNSGRLRLNRVSEQEVINEYYAEMSRNITSMVNGEGVMPHKKSPVKDEVVRIITSGDRKKLLKAQKNGAVGAKENIIGWCMKQSECKFGGFTSITPCTGGDGNNPCSDIVIDDNREQEFNDDMAYYTNKMNEAPKDSPLHKAFKAEVQGYEKILDIIKRKKGGKNE
tara:strand:- start:11297 stop:13294 length:1998 start_codon:yes stop_codon:yes gene_type:complete